MIALASLGVIAAGCVLSAGSAHAAHRAQHSQHHRYHHHSVHRAHIARADERASESLSEFLAPHQTLWWDHSGAAFHSAQFSSARSSHVPRTAYADARPRAWCGWYMRKLLGVADRSLNLARNWARWGRGGAPGIGAVVVWPHHVGKIVGGEPGHWIVQSGNDGHAVRIRARSVAGAIAFRWG